MESAGARSSPDEAGPRQRRRNTNAEGHEAAITDYSMRRGFRWKEGGVPESASVCLSLIVCGRPWVCLGRL